MFKFIKIIFFLIILFGSQVLPGNSESLKINNIKSFNIYDWNSDNKPDLIIYYNDGTFGYLKNISSNNAIIFDKPVIFQNKNNEIILENTDKKNSINPTKSKTVKTNTEIIDNNTKITTKETVTDLSNVKDNSLGYNKQKLIEFINSDNTSSTDILDLKLSNAKTIMETTFSDTETDINNKSLPYKLALMNFKNVSNTSNSFEMEWLKTGIPELLMYEFTFNKNIRLIPRKELNNLSVEQAMKNSDILITGTYEIIGDNLDIILYIYSDDYKNSIKISGKKDNDGVLTLISKLGKNLNSKIEVLLIKSE